MLTSSENWALYNSIDAAVDFHIWEDIKAELPAGGYQDIYRQTMNLYEPVIFMMTTGLLIDKTRLSIERDRVSKLQREAEAELTELAGFELNALSPKQCIAYFYGTLGQTPYTGSSGRPTTDDKAMARLARKGIREAKLVQNIRGYNKLKGTYLDVETDSDGRVRTSYNLRGTREGRISSSQNIFGTGMNLQNLHPVFKGFIVPDPDHFFIELDKRQSEWVITAYLCNDANMISAIERGEDVHAATAHMMTGIPIELIKKEAKLFGHVTDQDLLTKARHELLPEILEAGVFLPRSMSCRQAGKKSNHGLNYLMGYWRFALENEIPEAEAKQLVMAYREGYPGLVAYWYRIHGKLARDRTLINCFGRPRRFLGQWGDDPLSSDLLKAAISYMSQSANADLVNRAIIDIYWDDARSIKPLRLSAQVHDSVLSQYPIGQWKNAAKAILIMRDHLNPVLTYEGRSFQIETDLNIGLNWGEYHEEDNAYGMTEIPIVDNETELADRLEAKYLQLKQAA